MGSLICLLSSKVLPLPFPPPLSQDYTIKTIDVFLNLNSPRTRIHRFLLDIFIQGLVYTFYTLHVTCYTFYTQLSSICSGGVGSRWVLGAWVSDRTVVPRLLIWNLGLGVGPSSGLWRCWPLYTRRRFGGWLG